MLVSRDEQSCLVVSYREVKSCIDAAFGYVSPLWPKLALTLRATVIYRGPRAETQLDKIGKRREKSHKSI